MTTVTDDLLQCFSEQRLLEARSIFISEGIDASVARRVISDLLILDEQSNETINVYLNSPGGEINSGFPDFSG